MYILDRDGPNVSSQVLKLFTSVYERERESERESVCVYVCVREVKGILMGWGGLCVYMVVLQSHPVTRADSAESLHPSTPNQQH